jgi:hypothetical protein
MIFNYYLENSDGWAGIEFSHKNFHKSYPVDCNMCDNLIELLGGMALLSCDNLGYIRSDLEKYIDDLFTDKITFTWSTFDAGITTKFVFKVVYKYKINLKIIEEDEDEDKGICVFNDNLDFGELINNILDSCSKILSKYGILGYYQNFWREFPVSHYLLLNDYKDKKIVFDTFNDTIDNHCEKMNRTNIKDEILYLSETMKPYSKG